ncbi:MAG: hypothetical protein GY778_01610, partial [bacterium]|nr:hypothetical protein [bacterium]
PDASGEDSVAARPTMDYSVEVVIPAGYFGSPQDQGADDVDSDIDPATGQTAVINLSASDDTNDAGLYAVGMVSGFVWNDISTEGIQDVGEPGVNGVTVNLLDGAGASVATTTTVNGGSPATDGYYEFTNLAAGSYILEVIPLSGFSPQDLGGDDAVDSDVNQFTGQIAFTLNPGDNLDFDAGLVDAFTIGDLVWEDVDEDGDQTGESGMPVGVTVNLLTNVGALLASTTTDGSGNYNFTAPAGDYRIEVVPPIGYLHSPLDAVGVPDTLDSDVDPATGQTAIFTLSGNNNTIDAGLRPTATIGDLVWEDLNADGIQDPLLEPGIPNVMVNLLDGAGAPLSPPQSTLTDPSG